MMKNIPTRTRSRSRAACALALVSLLAACTPSGKAPTGPQNPAMNALTQNPSPRCFGRYLADLPDTLALNTEHGATIDGVNVAIDPMEEAKFKLLLQTREAELRSKHMNGEPDVPFLKKIEDTPNIKLGKVFNRVTHAGAADAARILELMAWQSGYSIKMWLNASDYEDPKYKNDPLFKDDVTDTPEKLRQLLNVYERARGRADNEIPTEQGICLHRGFVKGPPTDQEEVALFYNLKSTEDVFFKFYSNSGLVQRTMLLERGDGIEEMLKLQEGHTVRKGRRQGADGLAFEEWLMALRTIDRIPGTEFILEVHSKTASAKTPLLMVEMFNGARIPGPTLSNEESAVVPPLQKASLSEAEAVALWDAVTATLRPRPGAF
jgi:hypothetical protein